jgi:hypothetical protein
MGWQQGGACRDEARGGHCDLFQYQVLASRGWPLVDLWFPMLLKDDINACGRRHLIEGVV